MFLTTPYHSLPIFDACYYPLVSNPTPSWTPDNLSNPHDVADKASRVQAMFAAIAPSYDLNNTVHSLGLDHRWRKKAVQLADVKPTDHVLDVACGTGALTEAFATADAQSVTGIDYTPEMLDVARQRQTRKENLASITYQQGDAMDLPVEDQSVDVVSIAFGIRNVADPQKALQEFGRVLKPGGRLVILEFSLPRNRILLGCYNFYFHHIMPRTASWIARDRSGAYQYLPRSVCTFIDRENMTQMMQEAGFSQITVKPMTFGIAVGYVGIRQ